MSSEIEPKSIVDHLKKSGVFDKLRKEILDEFDKQVCFVCSHIQMSI
jgi:hypothetical protein